MVKKENRRRYLRMGFMWLFAIALLSGLLFGGMCFQQVSASKNTGSLASDKRAKAYEFKAKDLKVNVSVGLMGEKVCPGYYAPAVAEITNEGKNFTGYFRILVPNTSGGQTMFQKAVSVAAGETKRVSMVFQVINYETSLTALICDEDGDPLGKKTINSLNYNTQNLIGILSEETQGLGYLSNSNMNPVFISDCNITSDAKSIDLLDVLLINDYDTQKLSDGQVSAIEEWVRQGGTLVIGTGTQAEKTLQVFSGSLLEGTIGSVKTITTGFGGGETAFKKILRQEITDREQEKIGEVQEFLMTNLAENLYNKYSSQISAIEYNASILEPDGEIYTALRKKFSEEELKENLSVQLSKEEEKELTSRLQTKDIKKEITQLQIKNAKEVLTEQGEPLLSRLDYGAGCVLVAEFDFSLENSSWNSHGTLLLDTIYQNRSEERKKVSTTDSQYGWDYESYALGQGLRVNEVNGLPNLKLYGALLLLYAALVGPVFYFVLRRKKKRGLLWGLIPVTSIVFSVLIYLIGTSTRIQQAYVNYLSELDLSGEKGVQKLNTSFSLTNANNRSYKVTIADGGSTGPFTGNMDSISVSGEEDTGYQYGLEYSDKQTILHMDHLAAFESVNMENHQSVKVDGRIDFTELSLADLKNYSGIITNNLSYDLEDCILVLNKNIIRIGDLKAGESVSLKQLKHAEVFMAGQGVDYDWEMQVEELFGLDYTANDPESSRRAALLSNYGLEKDEDACYFYGFMKKDQETAFTKLFDYAKYGETAVVQPITNADMIDKTGVENLGKLADYVVRYGNGINEDGSVGSGSDTYAIYDLEDLSSQYKKILLQYRSIGNAEFLAGEGYYGEKGFLGEVSVVNQETGEAEILIRSGEEKEIANLKDYLDEDGQLVLQYHIQSDQMTQYFDYLCLPELILEGEDS